MKPTLSPVPGGWNGDGLMGIGVYRNGIFYLRNTPTAGAPEITISFGLPADCPSFRSSKPL